MGAVLPWACVLILASVPLNGSVTDGAGQPVAGASVYLSDTITTHVGPDVLGAATTDASGKFRIDRNDQLVGRGGFWSPTLWVYAPGHRVAFQEFKQQIPGPDEPVRFVLDPAATTPVRVSLPDGKPPGPSRVQVTRTHLQAPRIPDALVERLAVTTDQAGLGVIDGLRPEEVAMLDVTVADYVTQGHPTPASPEPKAIKIRAVGRLSVRVTADDPRAVVGWEITATSTPNDSAGYQPSTSWVKENTNPLGIAFFRPFAAGRITWQIKAPRDSLYMVEDPAGVVVKADELTEVTLPLRRSARVTGVIREAGGGPPIAGIKVTTRCLSANLTTDDPTTDASGQFTYTTLPGANNYILMDNLPPTLLQPPGPKAPTNFVIPAAATELTLAPIELRRAVLVRGRVIDASGQGVVGAMVNGSWKAAEFGEASVASHTTTAERGEFTLGGIAPGAQVRVGATLGNRTETSYETVLAREPMEPMVVHLTFLPTTSLTGTVTGPDGRAVEGAKISVETRRSEQMAMNNTRIRFESGRAITTSAAGTFETPSEIPKNLQYRVTAEAPGFNSAVSPWADADQPRPTELILKRLDRPRSVAGRVVDTQGVPVAGVEVFQSGDGPKVTSTKTDEQGHFEVGGISSGPAFLFVRSADYRMAGRLIPPDDQHVEIVISRRGQPALKRLVAAPPHGQAADRAIAVELLGPAWQDYLDSVRPDFTRELPVLDTMAALEPERVTTMIENQTVPIITPQLLANLVVSRVTDQPGAAIDFLDAIQPPELAAEGLIAMVDVWRKVKPLEFAVVALERAEKQTDQVADPATRGQLLIDLAAAWHQSGRGDRGGAAARKAERLNAPQPRMKRLPVHTLAEVMAPVDVEEALRLLESTRPVQSPEGARAMVASWIAATNPIEAKRLIDPKARVVGNEIAAKLVVGLAAAGFLDDAEALAKQSRGDALTLALLPAIKAIHLDHALQADQARRLVSESFDRLAMMAAKPALNRRTLEDGIWPVVAMAQLLPLVARVDPDRGVADLWYTLSCRPPHPFELASRPGPTPTRDHYLNLIALANAIAPYDRAAAEAVLSPAVERITTLDNPTPRLGKDGADLFEAIAAFDGPGARAIWEQLANDPARKLDTPIDPMRQPRRTKADARVAIARILSLPPILRANTALRAIAQPAWLDEIILPPVREF